MKLDAITLSEEFRGIMQEWLTPEQLREIDRLNAEETDTSICHSHDVCDPNQAMIDALERFGVEIEIHDDAQGALIDEAWAIVKRDGFAKVKGGD